MTESRKDHCTRILGDPALDGRERAEDLLPLVYDELRDLARGALAHERASVSVQPTMLVHEAFLRLVGTSDPGWNGRGHFFAAAARAMRRILVEQARRRARLRHGGGRERLRLSQIDAGASETDADVLALDEALRDLEAHDPRKGEIVGLRFFAGLTMEETAKALDLSLSTVEREWRFIRSWLKVELGERGR